MQITGQLPMTRARYGRMVRTVQSRWVWVVPVLGVLTLALATTAIVRGTSTLFLPIVELVVGMLFVLYPWLVIRILARKLRLADSPIWTYQVTPTGFTQSNPVVDTTVRWDQVVRSKESADAWALKLSAGGWLVMLKEAFDPAQLPQVAELVAAAGRPRSTA